jgi:hypothetical protein
LSDGSGGAGGADSDSRAKWRNAGWSFINFSPAISDEAGKSIRTEIRSWNLHLRSDKAIENLSRMFNLIIRGSSALTKNDPLVLG